MGLPPPLHHLHPLHHLQDRWLTVGGLRTRWWGAGPHRADARGATPLVLLHGIGCSVLEWNRTIEPLACDRRVVALDLPGSGATDKPAPATWPYGIDALADWVLQALAQLELGPVCLAGNSLGGRVALQCAIRAPGRVRSLVLADPAGVGRESFINFRLATLPLLGELLTRPNRTGLSMLWRMAFHDPARLEAARIDAKLADARAPGAQAAFLATLRSFLAIGGFPKDQVAALHAAVRTVQQPTLIVWGEQDHALPAAQGRHLAGLMPNARYAGIAACGHLPQLEQPEAFNALVAGFLAEADAGG